MVNLDKNKLAEIGVQFGNLTRRWNPKMSSYIFKKSSKIHILDLHKVISGCQKVGDYIKSLIEKKKLVLFLAAKKKAQEIVKEQAVRCGMPYIINKWKGGFLTNFREIGKKFNELRGLNSFIQKDSFKNLAKKEQAAHVKRQTQLQSIYEGVVSLTRTPEALFIIGLDKAKTASKEAKKVGIPVIAICNSNCNPQMADYVIPGSDENIKSITFFAGLVADSIIEARSKPLGESGSVEQEEKRKEVNMIK